jgi:hypothetical protein
LILATNSEIGILEKRIPNNQPISKGMKMQKLRPQSQLPIWKSALLKKLAILVISKSLRQIQTASRGYPFLSAMFLQAGLLLSLSAFLSISAQAADYPPADHQGADLIAGHGDHIWGLHENIGTFEVPVNATIYVLPHVPDILASGFLEIHANRILVHGTINARGAGYEGGNGGNGGRGEYGYPDYLAAQLGALGWPGTGPARGLRQEDGGYNVPGGNTDKTTDSTVIMGSGGGGGNGGNGGAAASYMDPGGGGGGGGAGGCGGGCVRLFSIDELEILGLISAAGTTGGNGTNGGNAFSFYNPSCGTYYAGGEGGYGGKAITFEQGLKGSGGNGLGGGENGAPGRDGGTGAGGGIFLYCQSPNGLTVSGILDARGGRNQLSNGGTVKLFYKGEVSTTDTIHSPRIYYRNLNLLPTPTPTPTPTPKPGVVILVPEDYSSIQDAIYAGTDGDEIIVSPGTYQENVHFWGKNILLRSTAPTSPVVVASTIIDGRELGSAITFSGSEQSSCIVSGFTIINGRAENGGGISGNGTQASVIDNVIMYNSTAGSNPYGRGGGIVDCHGLIQNNTITENNANYGGGLYNCSGQILQNVISNNYADFQGGGLYNCDGTIQENEIIDNQTFFGACCVDIGGGLIYCDGTIKGNIISGNRSHDGGGAGYCHGTIQDNVITGNIAYEGGALYRCNGGIENNLILENSAYDFAGGLCECNGTIQNNIISGNLGDYCGGLYSCSGIIQNNVISNNSGMPWGVYDVGGGLAHCSGVVRNNIISGNRSNGIGGGIAHSSASILNNTIWGNSADDKGGGLYDCDGTITNCIIWGNSSAAGAQLYACTPPSYCCIQDWTGGSGNIACDPQLVDPDNEDFHLQTTSPCVDAGCFIEDLSSDFEGNPRPWNGTSEPRGDGSDFDIGADEYSGPLSYEFTSSSEGWTTCTAMVFSPPEWILEPERLSLASQNNTNTFGYWSSLGNAIPVAEGYLYRARFVVSTDVTLPEVVPQIRLRANSSNFQQADCLIIDSSGDGGASPTPEGTTYDLYFVPPANTDYCMLAFDLLNFNPYDAARAELALESVLVERFPLDALDESTTTVCTYDFEWGMEFWTVGDGTGVFTDPEFLWDEGALHMRSTTNTNSFGYWHNDPIDVIVEPDRLYRGTFEVRTDEADRSRVPQMRLRFNTANMQAARTLEIASIGDGANSPGTMNTTYDRLYFLPPPNCVGKGLIVSFDLLNFTPDDAPTASLILDRATIETLSLPALP